MQFTMQALDQTARLYENSAARLERLSKMKLAQMELQSSTGNGVMPEARCWWQQRKGITIAFGGIHLV